MKIAVGCDHIVTDIKNQIIDYLKAEGHEVLDMGTYDHKRTHYPIFGRKVGQAVALKKADLGIVLCGTGVGISNACNKVPFIRCALVNDPVSAKNAREKLDANVLAVGGRVAGMGMIEDIIDTFLTASYKGENDEIIQELNAMAWNEDVLYNEELFDVFLKKWDEGYYHD